VETEARRSSQEAIPCCWLLSRWASSLAALYLQRQTPIKNFLVRHVLSWPYYLRGSVLICLFVYSIFTHRLLAFIYKQCVSHVWFQFKRFHIAVSVRPFDVWLSSLTLVSQKCRFWCFSNVCMQHAVGDSDQWLFTRLVYFLCCMTRQRLTAARLMDSLDESSEICCTLLDELLFK